MYIRLFYIYLLSTYIFCLFYKEFRASFFVLSTTHNNSGEAER